MHRTRQAGGNLRVILRLDSSVLRHRKGGLTFLSGGVNFPCLETSGIAFPPRDQISKRLSRKLEHRKTSSPQASSSLKFPPPRLAPGRPQRPRGRLGPPSLAAQDTTSQQILPVESGTHTHNTTRMTNEQTHSHTHRRTHTRQTLYHSPGTLVISADLVYFPSKTPLSLGAHELRLSATTKLSSSPP